MTANDHILVVTLGGTIESFYNPEQGTPNDVPLEDGADKTIIPAAMAKMGIAENCDFLKLAMRDSKYRTDAELDAIVRHAAEHGYEHVMIVEGTDVTPEQASVLKQKVEAWAAAHPDDGMDRKSFVFAGAMEPLRDANKQWREIDTTREKHDGWFNLGMAKHHLEKGIPPDVYVRTKEALWPANRVYKYRELDGDAPKEDGTYSKPHGPDAKVTFSEFRGTAHPDSRGKKITH